MSQREFMECLQAHKASLTRQEFKTLRGQARAGSVEAAMKGLEKLLRRRCKSEQNHI